MSERKAAWRELRTLTDQLNREEDEALAADGTLDAALLRQEREILASSTAPDSSPLQPMAKRELKSARHFRAGLVKLGAERLVEGAVQNARPDSGPLNPEKLVIHSLATMRELSPHYLARFVTYIDTLFYLDHSQD